MMLIETGRRPAATMSLGRTADAILAAALATGAAAALVIGQAYGELALAIAAAGVLLGMGAAACWLAPGTTPSRLVLALCLSAMVALHIQLGRGTIEFHFGVFVTLALLLVYRDWRPIVLSAAFFAVHHLVFDRLQAAGVGVYCTPAPDFLKIVMHAGYVVVQSSLEVFIAVKMGQLGRQGDELRRLVAAIDTEGRVSLNLDHIDARTDVAQALKRAIARMNEVLAQVLRSSADVNTAASAIATSNQDLSERSEQTASHLQRAASSMSRLTHTVGLSADAAREATRLAASAAEVAARGGMVVSRVVSTMNDINASSQRIGDIIGVIDGIAFQTNILALNAAVEAARAGEEGRGFAVVAGEVRSLAQRSAQAAREVKTLIGASVNNVAGGASLVADAGRTMNDIVVSAQRVAAMVGAITASMAEQSAGILQVNSSVAELEQMTQQNVTLVEQSAAASDSLKQQARQLADVVGTFSLAPT